VRACVRACGEAVQENLRT